MVVDDATVESLAPIQQKNPRGLTLVKDELVAWATACNQYKGGKGSDRQFYCSSWSRDTLTVNRKGEHASGPLLVTNPFLSILGGLISLAYGLHLRKIPVILGYAFGTIVYVRNLMLIHAKEKSAEVAA